MVKQSQGKVELLAPAGNLEKLEIAINYGADAVYLSGKNFNLRNFSENFSFEGMSLARELTSKKNIKMYVAINIYARNKDAIAINKYLHNLAAIQPDGIIVSDPSIFIQAKQLIPSIPIHISTQSNTTNTSTALFWKELGAKRINTARELSLEEIKEIVSHSKIEVETFVHGAMCMAYSGRCLVSNFMNQRGSNNGMCCQPCRFNYAVMEEKRPGEYYPVYEDKRGSYIFNSKDLCMLDHVPDLINAGINSLKIEGRMKGINYVATTTKVYREAIDAYYNPNLSGYDLPLQHWHSQLNRISNRGYCTGFFFNEPNQVISNFNKGLSPDHMFMAKVLQSTSNGRTLINVRNKIFLEDRVTIMSPAFPVEKRDRIKGIMDESGEKHNFAQPGSNVYIELETRCKPLDLIQKSQKTADS